MRLVVLLVSVVASCASCGATPDPHARWGGTDGEDVSSGLVVYGMNAAVDVSRLSLRTWPELDEVDHVVRRRGEGLVDVVELVPSLMLTARWYATRCSAQPSGAQLVGGVPLSDGSYVWRFFGNAVAPEVVRIVGQGPDVHVEFSRIVQPLDDRTPHDVVSIAQDGVVCAPVFGGEPIIGQTMHVRCAPELDWYAGFLVQIDGLESMDALSDPVPLRPLDTTVRLQPGDELVFVPPRATRPRPPSVPSELCADVDCL